MHVVPTRVDFVLQFRRYSFNHCSQYLVHTQCRSCTYSGPKPHYIHDRYCSIFAHPTGVQVIPLARDLNGNTHMECTPLRRWTLSVKAFVVILISCPVTWPGAVPRFSMAPGTWKHMTNRRLYSSRRRECRVLISNVGNVKVESRHCPFRGISAIFLHVMDSLHAWQENRCLEELLLQWTPCSQDDCLRGYPLIRHFKCILIDKYR